MKTAQGGYKAMLRDKVPLTVDLALKWCKAKTRWVNHVYYSFIWFYSSKELRNQTTRYLLGKSKTNKTFNFHSTIDWDNLSDPDREYWLKIQEWVTWFEKSLLIIVESYKFYLRKGESSEMIKKYICEKHLNTLNEDWQDKLYKHILPHIIEHYV